MLELLLFIGGAGVGALATLIWFLKRKPQEKDVRQGEESVRPAAEIVPGDVVFLSDGDMVPADMRLIESANLKIQEASLTGESVPAEKDADEIIASFRISSLTFNRYLQQTCRYRCMRYMRNQSRRKATERALIFSDMTIHEKQLSENLIPYSSPESTEPLV